MRYASPNAVSAIHRMGHMGDVVGEVLAQIVAVPIYFKLRLWSTWSDEDD